MWELSKTFLFESAHTLNRVVDREASLRIHGHSYRAQVTVRGQPDPDKTPAGVDVAAYLERHGIRASFSTTPRERSVSVGATLLNRATDLHADLLVMGLYSHARMHERVLGGATRTILETMTVPVLLSH